MSGSLLFPADAYRYWQVLRLPGDDLLCQEHRCPVYCQGRFPSVKDFDPQIASRALGILDAGVVRPKLPVGGGEVIDFPVFAHDCPGFPVVTGLHNNGTTEVVLPGVNVNLAVQVPAFPHVRHKGAVLSLHLAQVLNRNRNGCPLLPFFQGFQLVRYLLLPPGHQAQVGFSGVRLQEHFLIQSQFHQLLVGQRWRQGYGLVEPPVGQGKVGGDRRCQSCHHA